MFGFLLQQLVLPLAVEAVKSYVKTSDSTKDDKVLEIVQTGAKYLAPKDNNSLDENTSNAIRKSTMKKLQGI